MSPNEPTILLEIYMIIKLNTVTFLLTRHLRNCDSMTVTVPEVDDDREKAKKRRMRYMQIVRNLHVELLLLKL